MDANIANAALAVATVVLAGVTFWLVLEARESRKEEERYRKEEERKRKEVVFRAAILELSSYIIALTPRDPSWWAQPNVLWDYPMKFPRLTELMESMWIDSKLWERITLGSLVRIKFLEAKLDDQITTHPHTDQNQNELRNTYRNLDLYLKQLIRYVFCEMQRQKLATPSGIWNSTVFQPLAGNYGDSKLFEVQIYPPLPPQPDDKAFEKCRLEVLFAAAYQAAEAESQSLQQTLPSSIAL